MKYAITFKGSNASGFVRYGGVEFPCGDTVTVEAGKEPGQISSDWLKRLENHQEFEVKAVGHAAKSAEKKD